MENKIIKKNNKITKNAVFNLVYSVVNVIFPLISSIYISRILSPSGVGLISYVTNFTSYFVMLAPLGITVYGVKMVARCDDEKELNKLFSELFFINLLSTVFFSIFYLITILCIEHYRINLSLYIISGFTLFLNIFNVDWLFKGLENYKYITIRNLVVKVVSLVLMISFVKGGNDVIIYLIISTIITSLNHILNYIHAHKYIHILFDFSFSSFKKHFTPLLVLLISIIASDIYLKMDVTMLGLLTSESNVGFYSNALRIENILLTIIVSFSAVSLPKLSDYYSKGNINLFNSLISELFSFLLLLSIPACIGIQFVANDAIIILFGIDFLPAGNTLKILSFLFIIKGIGDLLAYQLVVAINREKIFLPIRIAAAVLNFILNYFLISLFKQDGAAIATVLTELFTLVVVILIIRKQIRIKMSFNAIFSLLVANTSLILVCMLCRLLDEVFLRLAITCIAGVGAYFFVLLCFKNQFVFKIINVFLRRVNES